MKKVKQRINPYIALWRATRLFTHFLLGIIRVLFLLRYCDDSKKMLAMQAWSKKLLQILGIELVIRGQVPKGLTNTLVVSNHISWLDILVIFTVLHPRFVAKKEIANWPIIGQIAKIGKTIFINRDNKRTIMQVNSQLSSELLIGNNIAVFPEGTTSTGEFLLPFKASLFEPVYQSKGHVLPLVIKYKDIAGNLNKAPAFCGDVTLLGCIWNILMCHRLKIDLTIESLVNSASFINRGELALKSQKIIQSHWE